MPGRFFELTGYPSYVAFAALGLAFTGLALASLDDGGSAVYDEERQGTWDLLALAPFNRFTWIFAKVLAGLVASAVDLFVLIAIGGLLFPFVLTPATLLASFLGILGTIVGLTGFAFLMAAVGLAWKEPHAIAVLLSPVIIFVSGMLFPVQALPPAVQAISQAFPLTHGLDVVRGALLLGLGIGDLAPAYGRLVVTAVAFAFVGFAAFRRMEKRALETGRMGQY